LKLRTAPEMVASMAVRSAAVVKCLSCGVTFDTPAVYADHGCVGGEVGVGWYASTEPPAEPSAVSREEFVSAVPDTYLDGSGSDEMEGAGRDRDGADGQLGSADLERVEELVRTGEVSGVIEAMGRVGLPPSARERVEAVVGCASRRRGGGGSTRGVTSWHRTIPPVVVYRSRVRFPAAA
jgi:hypothetical protein